MNLKHITTNILLVAIILAAGAARAVEPTASLKLNAAYTSNVFLDSSKESDFLVNPYGAIGLGFAEDFGVGYNFGVEAFTVNAELFSHWHEVYFYYNPQWGEDNYNEFLLRLSADTFKNDDSYSQVNYVGASILAGLECNAADYFALKSSATLSYRAFYDAPASDYLNAKFAAESRLTIQATRTTLTPRLIYDIRYYVRKGGNKGGMMSSTSSARTDRADSQLEAGLHISQGLWETAGLQLSYSYRALLGNNSFSDRQLASWRFAYLGEDFLFSGHRLYAAFTQMLPFDMKAVVGAEFLARSYGGWKAVDSAGAELASDRYDYRLTPSVSLDYVWGSDSESEYAYLIPFVTASVKYSYVRQWSNSFAFDTDAHIAEVLVGLEW